MSKLDELLKHVDEEETVENHRKLIKRLAESAFKDHVIEVEEDRIFYCAKPNTGIYSFRICFLPVGVIFLYGDIGQLTLQSGGFDWLESAMRHNRISDYVFEKTRPLIDWRVKQFMSGEAAKELRRMHDGVPMVVDGEDLVEQAREEGLPTKHLDDYYEEKPNPALAIKIAEEWLGRDVTGEDADSYGRATYDNTGDCEFYDCRDYTAEQLYCYHALSWFVRQRGEA